MNYSVNPYIVDVGDGEYPNDVEMYEIRSPNGEHLCNVDIKEDAYKLVTLLNCFKEFV